MRRRVRRTSNMFSSEMYLLLPQEDINEQQESTNQETIDINKLWPTRGFRGCNYMRKMAGPKSAITHISSSLWLLYLPALLYFSFDSEFPTPPFKPHAPGCRLCNHLVDHYYRQLPVTKVREFPITRYFFYTNYPYSKPSEIYHFRRI